MAKKVSVMCEMQGDVALVTLLDARILEAKNIEEIGEELFSLVKNDYRTKMILNLDNVVYLSSAVLGKIMALNKKIKRESGALALINVKDDIREIFTITKLDAVIPIFDDLRKAVDTVSKGGVAPAEKKKSSGVLGWFKK